MAIYTHIPCCVCNLSCDSMIYVMTTSLISLTASTNCLELKLLGMRRCVANGISIRPGTLVRVCLRLWLALYPTGCRQIEGSLLLCHLKNKYHNYFTFVVWLVDIVPDITSTRYTSVITSILTIQTRLLRSARDPYSLISIIWIRWDCLWMLSRHATIRH